MTRTWNVIAGGLGLVAVTMLAVASPAEAQLGKAEQKCRAAAAKGLGGLVKTVQKEIGACHKSQNGEKIGPGIDCNDTEDAGFPSKSTGKIDKALAKLDSSIAGKCNDKEGNLLDAAFAPHISCPAPCTGAVSNPMIDEADLISCLSCLGVDAVEAASAAVYGSPSDGLTKDEQKCHSGLIKGYAKLVNTSLKDQQGCQKGADKDGNNDTSACVAADVKGKVQKAIDKAAAGIAKSCPTDALLDNLGTCAGTAIDCSAEDGACTVGTCSAGSCVTATR